MAWLAAGSNWRVAPSGVWVDPSAELISMLGDLVIAGCNVGVIDAGLACGLPGRIGELKGIVCMEKGSCDTYEDSYKY